MIAGEMDGQPEVPIRRAEPSWASVLFVTLQLWLSRRLARPPTGPGRERRSGIRWPLVAFVLVLVILALAGLQLSGAISSSASSPRTDSWVLWAGLLFTALPVATTLLMLVRAYLRRARGRHRVRRAALAGISARSLTAVAASLAGRTGWSLHQESDAHLAGESGHDVANWAKVKQAAGFVRAGVRYRLSDWADAGWRPVDAVLRSRFLSNLVVAVPTIVIAFEVLTHKGTMTLLTSLGSIFGTWLFLAGMIKAGRKYRDAEPSEPRARQAGK